MDFSLEGIHSTEDLLSFIPTLSNPFVNFISCQGLNDACLELLSKPNPHTHLWNLEMLRHLTILRCPGISVRGLKDLVECRLAEAISRGYGVIPGYGGYDELTPLRSLQVFDCGLSISPEDAQWFKEKVEGGILFMWIMPLKLFNNNDVFVPSLFLPGSVMTTRLKPWRIDQPWGIMHHPRRQAIFFLIPCHPWPEECLSVGKEWWCDLVHGPVPGQAKGQAIRCSLITIKPESARNCVSWLYVYMAERPVQEESGQKWGIGSLSVRESEKSHYINISEPVNEHNNSIIKKHQWDS